ncbi:MAG: FtsX-like permease family protein [Gemmatimonadota bacterium]
MNRFPLLLARWEGRQSLRRVGVYMLSIALGVAALVAVRSFREDVARSVRSEARVLLGADLRISSRAALEPPVQAFVDSLTGAGHGIARTTTAGSMVLAPSSGITRLLQVRAVEGPWPFYGEVTTRPAGLWPPREGAGALVDPAALTQMGIGVGDTLSVGSVRVPVLGTVEDLPTSLGFQTAIGPRIYLDRATLDRAGIIGFGSLVRYETYLRMADEGARDQAAADFETRFEDLPVGVETADEQAQDVTDAVGFLGRYLGLVGLGALLLGGVGVGSAIHVFVKERLTEVAVLRCLGARQASVFTAYLLQAAGLGLLGALVGGAAGVLIQHALPDLLASVLPVAVETRLSWGTLAWGVGTGLWVALVFALLPLLTIRDAPPLRALRQAMEVERRGLDGLQVAAVGVGAASVLGLCIIEAPSWQEGVGFAMALAATTLVLWGAGWGLTRLAHRLLPRRGPYPLRQGLANLFRPRNQTVSVTLALGFGAFVVATVLQVRANLARDLALEEVEGQPNLLLFDIQDDQRAGLLDLLPPEARGQAEVTPLVPARIRALKGLDRVAMQALPEEEQPSSWAVRRDYRHTWRAELTDAETLVEGAWWPDASPVSEGVARVSLEADLAEDLKVGVGDRVTWDVSGLTVESEVVSLRTVDWNRFQTNFFVVFEPGSLEQAPSTWVVLARIPGDSARADFQFRLVESFPNVSALDITRIQEVIEAILAQVTQAIAILAGFAALAGILVLTGALAASRHQRAREGALLRTLGARGRQILAVLFTEYAALAALATLTGLGLALAASWALVTLGFGISFRPDATSVAGIAVGMTLLTVASGLLGSRDLLRRPPLPVLRGE